MSPANKSLVTVTEEPLNAETPLAALRDPVTPSPLVYVRNHFAMPELDPGSWRLVIGGAVRRPMALTLDELKSRPHRSVTMALECAGNGRLAMSPRPPGTAWGYGAISVVRFTGTPLAAVLEEVDLDRKAVEVLFRGADAGDVSEGRQVQFARSLPLDAALAADPLLAWDLNNEPLAREHGAPLRVVVPGWYGMAAVKWLEQIDVLTAPFDGFFQKEHYVYSEEQGLAEGTPVRRILVRSIIAGPSEGQRLGIAPQTIEGIAWSGSGPITRVEVSTDGGGNWQAAALEPSAARYGASRWTFAWSPTEAGRYTLLSRATDASGNGQPAGQRWNRLGYGNNGPQAVTVEVG